LHPLLWAFLGFSWCVLECLNKLVPVFHALLSLNPSSLFVLSGCSISRISREV
jgi:hypothetical protein